MVVVLFVIIDRQLIRQFELGTTLVMFEYGVDFTAVVYRRMINDSSVLYKEVISLRINIHHKARIWF